MANINKTTTTDLDSNVTGYSVTQQVLDGSQNLSENYYDFDKSPKYLGYYLEHAELNRAINSLGIYSTGLGFTVESAIDKVMMEKWDGIGHDSINDILFNLFVNKKIHGDSFAEIVREGDVIVNLIPLDTYHMRIVTNEKGRIIRYEYKIKDGKREKYDPKDIFHLCNDRLGDEIHGRSVIEICEWVISARKEAMESLRTGILRSTIRVIYVDLDNPTAIANVKTQWANALNAKEAIILPGQKGKDFEVVDYTFPDVGAFIQWIQYLENFFYQAVGIPRVIATSENYTEAASKVGFLTFQPIYTHEQVLLEQDIWNQLAIKIKFNRPPELTGMMQQSEAKNTGQMRFQPNEVQASMVKNE